mgnify:CR=1 FL=1
MLEMRKCIQAVFFGGYLWPTVMHCISIVIGAEMLPPGIGGLREEMLGPVAAVFDLLKADMIAPLIFAVVSKDG